MKGFGLNRRALAPVIAYVLLIALGVALSGVGYGFLKQFAEEPEVTTCVDAADLNIKDYSCVTGKSLCLYLENQGLFNADGYELRLDNKSRKSAEPYVINSTGIPLKAGEEFNDSYDLSFLGEVKFAEIQAYQNISGKKQLCPTVISKEILCKPYGYDCEGEYIFGANAVLLYSNFAGSGISRIPLISKWDGNSWVGDKTLGNLEDSDGQKIKQFDIDYGPSGFDRWVAGIQKNDGKIDIVMNDRGNEYYCSDKFNTSESKDNYRVFDISFEQKSGKAIVVYSNKSNGGLLYSTWNGGDCGFWSSPEVIDNDFDYNWVNLKNCPSCLGERANEVSGIAIGPSIVKAFVWDGNSWLLEELSTQVVSLQEDRNSVQVSYESDSREALFTWSEDNRKLGYVLWDGDSFVNENLITIPNRPSWQSLKSDPSSDKIMLVLTAGASTSSSKLYTALWDGNSWINPFSLDHSDLQNDNYFSADFEWESEGGNGLLVWGTTNSGEMKFKKWTGSAWGGVGAISVPGSSKHLWVSLIRVPNWAEGSSKIIGVSSDQSNPIKLYSYSWNGANLNYAGSLSLDAGRSTGSRLFALAHNPDDPDLFI